MDSNSVSRILVGLILLLTTFSSYLFNLELFLITILIILISYDFYNLKIYKLSYLIFFTLLISLKSDYLNAEYLFEELEIDTSTKTEDDSSALPTNPFELVEMIRRQNSMNDATDPSDAIDDALRSFNSLEEN